MQSLRRSSESRTEECAAQLLATLPPVLWFVRRRMRAHRGRLSMPQFRALVRVDVEPVKSLTVVSDHLGVSLSAASRIVGGLVLRGLVRRAGSDGDRRQISLHLTPSGRAVLRTARSAAQRELRKALSPLTDTQEQVIIDALRALQGIFGTREQVIEAAHHAAKNARGSRGRYRGNDSWKAKKSAGRS